MPESMFEWLRDRLAAILHLDPSEIQPTSRFAEDLDANSIDLIEACNGAEAEFGVVVEDHVLYDLETVGQLVDVLERLRS